MEGSVSPELLSELRNPTSPSTQIASLRAVKNEIIGHDQRKQAWIESGIVPILSNILANRQGLGKYPAGHEFGHVGSRRALMDEDECCLQAIIVAGSLAQGGIAYVAPLIAGNTIPSLLSILSCQTCPQALTLTILQTLNTIADKVALQHHSQSGNNQAKQLSCYLFSHNNISSLHKILEQTDVSSTAHRAVELVADLIAKLCLEEAQKATLAESGVLDALAARMATFVVSQGFVLPGAENHLSRSDALGFIPPPAPENAKLTPILRAIAAIIEQSESRADHFLTSPALMTIFPVFLAESPIADVKKGPWKSPVCTGFNSSRQNAINPIDSLLPSVSTPQMNGSSSFPPLGSQPLYDSPGQFFSPSISFSDSVIQDEPENALVSWLLHVARSEAGTARLMAARLVTILFRLGFVRKNRTPMLGYLLVPLLVRMLDKECEVFEDASCRRNLSTSASTYVKEETPAVLASLVMDSRELQKYAVEAGAITRLSQMLRDSFAPMGEDSKPMWSAVKKHAELSHKSDNPELCLGPAGISPAVLHALKYREGVLKALAALSLFKEEYRKLVCDNGVVPHIIGSMKPFKDTTSPSQSPGVDGNSTSTLLAACAAARSLTRSISILRTSLIDAGVATPVCNLVKYQDVEVQIAATAVVSNIALEFSPMKEAIIGANMIATLCEHSHSLNAKLRLESLWALKHIAYNSTNDIKMKIIEGLGSEWITEVISYDPIDSRRRDYAPMEAGPFIEMGTPNAAGEKVDLLNPVSHSNGKHMSVLGPDSQMTDTTPLAKPTIDTSSPGHARRRKLALHGDLDHTKQLRRDEIQIQEQAFDLIRNLICGNGAAEMIEFLFQTIGQTALFDIMAEKLRPRPLASYNRKDSRSSKTIPAPTEIICAVTYVMIHLAAGLSRHRRLLTLHKDLLKLMVPLFNHSNKQVRVNCLWVVINLTFEDDVGDRESCHERASKLKSLGVLQHLNDLECDEESDVRERTKTALHLLRASLK